MSQTLFKQKLLLVSSSIFFTLILLETGLRIAGGVVLYLQDRHNHLSFQSNEYRILCLGESTTALGGEDSYPSQLEQLLNAQNNSKQFTVINKGIVSTTTEYILSHLDQNLDIYKPQMVIVMMGINDKAFLHNPNKSLWWENLKSFFKDFRVYKLSHLLYEHITHKIKEINSSNDLNVQSQDFSGQVAEDFFKNIITNSAERFSEHMTAAMHYQQNHQYEQANGENRLAKQSAVLTSSTCIELAKRYRIQGMYQEAQEILEKASMFNTNDEDLYKEWGQLYLAQEKNDQAVKAFQAALVLNPKDSDILLGLARAYYQEHRTEAYLVYAGYLQLKPQDYWGHIELARWLRENKTYDLAQVYLNKAIELGPDYDQAYLDLGQVFDDLKEYQQEENFYLKEISLHPKSPRLYESLGKFYQKSGKEDLARSYLQKAAEGEVAEYLPVTLVNYRLALDKILERHIQVIIMQYPLRDISPLKNYLGEKKGVIYLENKQNFKQALTKNPYGYYFKDNFAYNFGHCTRAGNQLIANHLATIILKNE